MKGVVPLRFVPAHEPGRLLSNKEDDQAQRVEPPGWNQAARESDFDFGIPNFAT